MTARDSSKLRAVSNFPRQGFRRICGTGFVVAATLLALSARVEPADLASRGPAAFSVPWSFLSLQGERLGNRVAAEVRIEALRGDVEQARFLPSPRGEPVCLSAPDMLKLSLRIQIDIIGRPRILLENQVWLDPSTGLPLYLVRTRSGLNDYHQRFRFTSQGVFRRQREPASAAEAAQPPESWSKVGEHFYAYPADEAGGHPVSETLIYLLSAGAIPQEGETELLRVFHKRQLHRVSFRRMREEPMPFDFCEKTRDAEIRHAGTMPVRVIQIESRPIGSYKGDVEDFDFVNDGMRVYLSLDGRMPLRISCEVPLMGRVGLSLKEIRFN